MIIAPRHRKISTQVAITIAQRTESGLQAHPPIFILFSIGYGLRHFDCDAGVTLTSKSSG